MARSEDSGNGRSVFRSGARTEAGLNHPARGPPQDAFDLGGPEPVPQDDEVYQIRSW